VNDLLSGGDRWAAGAAYDLYMGRWSRPLARAFVEWLRPAPGAHWLEVGCGTGSLTTAILDLGAPTSLTACDPSAPFIDHARHHITDPRVSFDVADAATLPEERGKFDIAVSALVLNFVPDVPGALASMRSRVHPDGVIAACVWDYADGMQFLRHFWDEAIALDPTAAALDEGRRFPLCRAGALEPAFRAAGLDDVEAGALEVPTVFDDFDEYWRPFLGGTGPAPAYVASLDAARRDALRQALHLRLPRNPAGHIALRARAWTARGRSGGVPDAR